MAINVRFKFLKKILDTSVPVNHTKVSLNPTKRCELNWVDGTILRVVDVCLSTRLQVIMTESCSDRRETMSYLPETVNELHLTYSFKTRMLNKHRCAWAGGCSRDV